MNNTDGSKRHPDPVRGESQMGRSKEGDHVDHCKRPCPETDICNRRSSEASAKYVYCNVDQLYDDASSGPWPEDPMATKDVPIREVL